MDTLNSRGLNSFIKYACQEAYVLAGRYYRPDPNRSLDASKTISFKEFMSCVYKYTECWKHPVRLNAEIVENEAKTLHRLVVRGIRDPGLRQHLNPQCFPGRQEGVWDCVLEEALTDGLTSEEIQVFRQTLNLVPKHGISDKDFFQRRIDLPI